MMIDRLIVHQFDPVSPRIGGIDTCISDMVALAPKDMQVAIVGMTADRSVRLGEWTQIAHRNRDVLFVPVARFGGGRSRHIPHSAILAMGLARWRRKLPAAPLQVHRLDVAAALWKLRAMQHGYIQFIHNPHGSGEGVIGAGSDSFWRYAPWAYRHLESILTHADHVVVFSRAEAKRLQDSGISAFPWQTWFDPRIFFPKPSARLAAALRIVVVGRLERQKDPTLAIDVLAELDRQGVEYQCSFVGDGSMRHDLEKRVQRLDIAERVTFAGSLPRDHVAASMRAADVLLLTSHYEGSPRVVIEALATGTPVAAAAEGDPDGIVTRGRTGCRAKTRSAADLAEAVVAAAAAGRETCVAAVAGLRADIAVPRLVAATNIERSPTTI